MGYQTKRKQMNCYETLFVVKPTLTEEEIKAQIEKVKAVLEKEGTELLATNDMGMRKLAYPVQKNNRGYYTVLFYKASGNAISEVERNLRINEEVIKFLTIKYSNTKEIAQFNKQVESANKNVATQGETPATAPAKEAPAKEVSTEEAPAESTPAEETQASTEA